MHVKRTRPTFSLAWSAQHEMSLGARGRDTISRFLRGDTTPQPSALAAMTTWARVQGAPDSQTVAPGLKPLDYWLNTQLNASVFLCGVPFARLRDWTQLLKLGELSDGSNLRARNGLAPVLRQMDHEDSQFAVESCLLAGDLSMDRKLAWQKWPGCRASLMPRS